MAGTAVKLLTVTVFIILNVSADTNFMVKELQMRKDLELALIDLLNTLTHDYYVTCITIITDPVYLNVFEGTFFKKTLRTPIFMAFTSTFESSINNEATTGSERCSYREEPARTSAIVVEEYEDLLAPNFDTLESLRQARKECCNVYVIILANGVQVARLLKFGERYHILDTRAKYIMLHDIRLFHSNFHYIWKQIVNVVFIKYHQKIVSNEQSKTWFDLTTVPFPNPIEKIFIPKHIDIWKDGKFRYGRDLYADKTGNMDNEVLNVVYYEHVPSIFVIKSNESNKVGGVEIEILNTLAQRMNFKPKLYQAIDAEYHKWGQRQPNGSYSGLLGEIVYGKADLALGNLQYTPHYLDLTDLSIPYTTQCWTFLTPEALTDNSWKTLILPFKLNMWIAVLLVLLVTGSIFYGLALYYKNLLIYAANTKKLTTEYNAKPVGLYLFGELTNSILYTYGMLLVVSLPKLPSGWSIRLLTGWYWLYCILLVVSYRASMTAILANPAPRVTIDTLKELVDSKIECGGWGVETKKFFVESLDELTQKIGSKFRNVDDPNEAAKLIVKGTFAYYDSANFLKYLSVKRKNNYKHSNDTTNATDIPNYNKAERDLHIMSDCVVNVPISIGFHKNSPLKPLADIYIRRLIENGLVDKWINDGMYKIRFLDTKEDEIKALMNLKKMYCAFIALGIGYSLSFLCLLGEFIHWHCIVKKDPNFDKYAIDVYYKNKKHKK